MKSYFITGGTGSLGRALIRHLLDAGAERVCSYARCEVRAARLEAEYMDHPNSQALRVFVGDVRDPGRLRRVMPGCDVLIHTAALKRVDSGSYHPDEIVKTNVTGTENVIDAALTSGIRKVMFISSDKAVHPQNIYGTSKLMAEYCAISSNSWTQARGLAVSVCRYGNVLGSRGSVVELWRQAVAEGKPLRLTDERMTRFWITLDEAVAFILDSIQRMAGGEIFIPILPSAWLIDLAEAVAPGHPIELIGLRPGGEKLYERLLADEEGWRAKRQAGRIVVAPAHNFWGGPEIEGDPLPLGFTYASHTNEWFLMREEVVEWLLRFDPTGIIAKR